VEKSTGWPVSLVELRTTHHARFVTDNTGVIAFDLPELMGRETWFDVVGHGYEVPKDGFGLRGVRLRPERGKTLKVEVNRTVIARRLGRITGGGIFAESQKLGQEREWRESSIVGCDSVQNAMHRGRLFWLWGDTILVHYPLGIFDGTGATTAIRPLTKFEPPLRLKLDYFTDEKGAPRGIAKMPGEGPTWVTGYVSLPDKNGTPRLVGSYLKIKPPMEAYQCGLCVWNEASSNFDLERVLWRKSDTAPKPPLFPEGHPALWKDSSGKSWVLFGNPLPTLRCPATFEAWRDSSTWEVLKPQASLVSPDGQPVKPHSGSIAWNPWRKRWVTVFMQTFGKPSAFGELWYAEADAPTGPWGVAVKILSHENYTFYNPRLHPEFTLEDSPILIFEGTYTMQFADKPAPTPRYDYNQILYRLDLDDPALRPAQKRNASSSAAPTPATRLERIVLSADGDGFMRAESKTPFRPWGVNYGNRGRLIEDFWEQEWDTVAGDFREIKQIGGNVVRVHLQFGRFMDAPDKPNSTALRQLGRLLALAETTGLYLDVTGLACYRPADTPKWYDALAQKSRWEAQAAFWRAVAGQCAESPAVFCYGLMNEPLSPAAKRTNWYSGKLLGDYDFLQYIARDPAGRTRGEIVIAWIDKLTAAIREKDHTRLITVGLLPWVTGWQHLSGFVPKDVAPHVDFLSVHIYPKTKQPDEAPRALRECAVGKPVVIEETFPLECTVEELETFLRSSRDIACGWIWHYDGATVEDYDALEGGGKLTLPQALWRQGMRSFIRLKPEFVH
jgi:hypothetical protein